VNPNAGITSRRFRCGDCNCSFKKKSDVERHESSVHHHLAPFFCREPGCTRVKGFTRKDNYNTHLRTVHQVSKDGSAFRGLGDIQQTHETLRREDKVKMFEGCSKRELVYLIMHETEKYENERERRMCVEDELRKIQQRSEEREDMWLNTLAAIRGG